MAEERMKAPLRRGDVTEVKEYVQLANEAIAKEMNQAHTEYVKKLEKEVKIKRIKSMPFTYTMTQEFYEARELEECRKPSKQGRDTADYIRSASEYDRWDMKCPKPVKDYAKGANDIEIGDSIYYESCECCSGDGKVPCTCENGSWQCSDCEGMGEVRCTFCYGSGEETCSSCGGGGRERSWDGSEGPCRTCGGRGYVWCGYCNNGRMRCRNCGGDGYVICGICGGSQWVTCKDCTGLGGIKYSICLHQKFDVEKYASIVDGYHADMATYGSWFFKNFVPLESDDRLVRVCENEKLFFESSPENIAAVLKYEVPGYLPKRDWICNAGQRPKGLNAVKVIKRKEEVYQRNVLEIEYEFNHKPYKMLYDATRERCVQDKNPYSVEEKLVNGKDWVATDEYEEYLAKEKEKEKKREEERKVAAIRAEERRVESAKRQAIEKRRSAVSLSITNVLSGIVLLYLIGIGFPGCVTYWQERTDFFRERNEVLSDLLPTPFSRDVVVGSDYLYPVIFLKHPDIKEVVLKGEAAEKPILMLADRIHYLTVEDYEGESYKFPTDHGTTVTFRNCSNLQSIEVPESVGFVNLVNCTNMQSIELPESVTHLSLINCPNLQSIKAPKVHEFEVINCPKLRNVDLEDKDIQMTFTDYSNLEDIEVLEDMPPVETMDFSNVQDIDDSYHIKLTFENCSNLQDIAIPEGVEAVRFANCPNLQSATFLEGVESVELNTCPNLQSIEAPKTVSYIYIYDCPGLNDVNCQNPDCWINYG